ncbi:MAG: CoA transferase [Pseudomonadota bacterium]
MTAALQEIRVVELGQEIQGPYATLFLADMGAEVIKVENRVDGDLARQMTVGKLAGEDAPHSEFGQYFYLLNRGKRSLTLDLKKDSGKEVLRRLLRDADVLLTNFRPGVLERLGFGYEQLKDDFPRLIHTTASSWGPVGPWARRPSRDMLAQAASGVMSHTGMEGQAPTPAGIVMADYAGAMMAVMGTLAALQARTHTGRGQKVDTSMYGAMLAFQPWEVLQASLTGTENRRAGRGHQFLNGAWGAFKTRDGWLALAGIEDSRWPAFCEIIGRPDIEHNPDFDKDSRNFAGSRIHELLDAVFAEQDTDYWLEKLLAADIFAGEIAGYLDVLNSEQAIANNYIREVEHPEIGPFKMVGPPIALSDTPLRGALPSPDLGADSGAILQELGYDAAAIDALRNGEVV